MEMEDVNSVKSRGDGYLILGIRCGRYFSYFFFFWLNEDKIWVIANKEME